MNNTTYITLVDALGAPGAALLERNLEAELEARQIKHSEYLRLELEQRLVREWRGHKERSEKKPQ